MGIERRIDALEKATVGEGEGRGLLCVMPASIEQVYTSDAEVADAVRSYEAQHGHPPAMIVRVAWDGNERTNRES